MRKSTNLLVKSHLCANLQDTQKITAYNFTNLILQKR